MGSSGRKGVEKVESFYWYFGATGGYLDDGMVLAIASRRVVLGRSHSHADRLGAVLAQAPAGQTQAAPAIVNETRGQTRPALGGKVRCPVFLLSM